MSDRKITFRASEDLVERVEQIEEEEEESRSEIMREAVRHYLDSRGGGIGGLGAGLSAPAGGASGVAAGGASGAGDATLGGAIDAMLTRKIDAMIDRKLQQRDVNVTVEMPEERAPRQDTREARAAPEPPRRETAGRRRAGRAGEGAVAAAGGETSCPQCGEEVEEDHVHCPNCGAKTSQRVFCDCGDEVRSDWSFCPSCGRRTPSSHALQPPE